MITLQSGKTDEIIVIDNPEEIVGKLYINYYDLNSILIKNKRIFIKREMLGTDIEVGTGVGGLFSPNIDSFNVTPTTVHVEQTGSNTLYIEFPTEVLEEDIEVNITLDYTLDL